ncbi:hypothetical protein DTO013E5_557 [Penicillium roqueforti]|nr:hypothetical protein DTO013F2_7141 [Penicillium roqueforti]KAI2746824.1 hypothetical protein DTO012A1_1655 [Penicillium roqueforti]KAI2764293.1 hypothetical protein DTO006G1_711 [Penicillium roqueforti]KAI2766428.1 hypothetical protein DTO012A8_8343 [Penicillium roqueforti]KAI3141725.1 hypothetical protein CBS147326_1812 [Penicillium roqueforti]
MPFNVYITRQDGRWDWVFYIELDAIPKEVIVESTGWTHSFKSDGKDGNQYTARLNRTPRVNSAGNMIATIEEADLPKFHELCFTAIRPLPQKKHMNRLVLRCMMPGRWKQEPREWWLLIRDRAFAKGIFKPLDIEISASPNCL